MFAILFHVAHVLVCILPFGNVEMFPVVKDITELEKQMTAVNISHPNLETTTIAQNVTWKLKINVPILNLEVAHVRPNPKTTGDNITTTSEWSSHFQDTEKSLVSGVDVTTADTDGLTDQFENSETIERRSITKSDIEESSTLLLNTKPFDDKYDSQTSNQPISTNDVRNFTTAESFTELELSELNNGTRTFEPDTLAESTYQYEFDNVSQLQRNATDGKEYEENLTSFQDEIESEMSLRKASTVSKETTSDMWTSIASDLLASTNHSRNTVTTEVIALETEQTTPNADWIEATLTNLPKKEFNLNMTDASNPEKMIATLSADNDHDPITFETTASSILSEETTDFETTVLPVTEPISIATEDLTIFNSSSDAFSSNISSIGVTEVDINTTAKVITPRPDCPAPGLCLFWFMAQDTCAVDSHCLGTRICCKIRCSKTCIEV